MFHTNPTKQFQNDRKIGGEILVAEFKTKLESDINEIYNYFAQENEKKRKIFEASEYIV